MYDFSNFLMMLLYRFKRSFSVLEPTTAILLFTPKFFEIGILPELLGRWFSRPPEQIISSLSTPSDLPHLHSSFETASTSSHDTCLKYCYCQEGEHGQMVGCDNPGCPYQWFHLECLRLKSAPRSKSWYCPDCRKHEKFKKGK